jgi:Ser/Thr protein kinase RdoA (MazF antagonist)
VAIDPFAVLTTSAPNLSESVAAEVLARHYGLEGNLEPLASERDQNYLLHEASGDEFVLKIANSSEDAAVTDFQVAGLLHLEQQHPDIPVPRVIRTNDGHPHFRIHSEDGREHTLRLLSWLPGTPLEKLEPRPNVAHQLGQSLAELGKGLRKFEHAASDYPLLWDIKQAGHLISVLEHVPDEAWRNICRDRLEKFVENVEPRLRQCRSQVIFNDLNWGNVLADAKDPDRIAGIIDFGDMVKSPLIIDIAVACAYLCKNDDPPLSDVLVFLRGYYSVTRILPEEFELLPDLILMRSVQTIVIASWRASRYPENRKYILRSMIRAKATMTALGNGGSSNVAENFMDYCATGNEQ